MPAVMIGFMRWMIERLNRLMQKMLYVKPHKASNISVVKESWKSNMLQNFLSLYKFPERKQKPQSELIEESAQHAVLQVDPCTETWQELQISRERQQQEKCTLEPLFRWKHQSFFFSTHFQSCSLLWDETYTF